MSHTPAFRKNPLIDGRVRLFLLSRNMPGVDALSKKLAVSTRLALLKLRGTYPVTPEELKIIRAELGPEGWAFATGETDVLKVPRPGVVAA